MLKFILEKKYRISTNGKKKFKRILSCLFGGKRKVQVTKFPFEDFVFVGIGVCIGSREYPYSTARKYWCISTRRNLIRRHFVFLEFAAVGRKPTSSPGSSRFSKWRRLGRRPWHTADHVSPTRMEMYSKWRLRRKGGEELGTRC